MIDEVDKENWGGVGLGGYREKSIVLFGLCCLEIFMRHTRVDVKNEVLYTSVYLRKESEIEAWQQSLNDPGDTLWVSRSSLSWL